MELQIDNDQWHLTTVSTGDWTPAGNPFLSLSYSLSPPFLSPPILTGLWDKYRKSLNRPISKYNQVRTPACNQGPASVRGPACINSSALQQIYSRQHESPNFLVFCSLQYTNIYKADLSVEPFFETWLVFEARPVFKVCLVLR